VENQEYPPISRDHRSGAGLAIFGCIIARLECRARKGAITMKSILTALILIGLTFATTPSVQAKSADETKTEAKPAAQKVFLSPQKEGTKATCPVTGDQFTIAKDTVHVEYKGKHVYFCCAGCKKTFDKDPEKYMK
jgi:YHS domain-containing protein